MESIGSLEDKKENVEELMQALVAEDDERDTANQSDVPTGGFRQLEDAVLDLVNAMPRGVHDAEAVLMLRFLTDFRRGLADGQTDRAELASAKIRDVVARVGRRMALERFDDPQAAFAFVDEALNRQESRDIARLVGVSTRTLSTWRSGGPVQSQRHRVQLVAELVLLLRFSMTQNGLLMWFEDPADALSGKSPLTLVASEDRADWARLVAFARGGSGQLAA